ncbi:MAG TPA: DUF4214 domain-containing protein [Stellaceae bacterium]|nr:DUF4214 domain-containing protein [Stellaceae bacterium]
MTDDAVSGNGPEPQNVVAAIEPEELVTALYRSLLGREPDPAGFATYVNHINQGTPLDDVIKAFEASRERRRITEVIAPGDHLSIRTFLQAVDQAGGYDHGIKELSSLFAERRDMQDVRYFYRGFLKRMPENSTAALRPFAGLEAELRRFTLSDEFKKKFGMMVLEEFPHLQRDLFIHIPKTGGNSVHSKAEQDPHYAVVRSPLGPPEDVADWPHYFFVLARKLFSTATHIHVTYHLQVKHVLDFALLRPQDHIYTLIREPVSLMISYINYALTRIDDFVGDANPAYGVSDMRRAIGFDVNQGIGAQIDDQVFVGLLNNYIPKNPACACLGANDAQGAFENIQTLGVKVYHISEMDLLLEEHGWSPAHENVSRKYVTAESLSNTVMYQIHALSFEDFKLYERLKEAGFVRPTPAEE